MLALVRISAVLLMISVLVCTASADDPGPNLENKAVKKVTPVYPPLAKLKRIQGMVKVKLQVGGDGKVTSAEFIDGNAVFKPSSLDAAKQWVFQRSPEGVTGHITFKYQLDSGE